MFKKFQFSFRYFHDFWQILYRNRNFSVNYLCCEKNGDLKGYVANGQIKYSFAVFEVCCFVVDFFDFSWDN